MRRRVFFGVFSVLMGMAMAFGVYADHHEKAYKVGDKVEAFSLPDAEGKQHNLADDLGKKIIVLEFWNMNCPVSRDYVNRMKALQDKFAKGDDAGVVFYAIDSNHGNEPADIKKFAGEQGMKYPVLKDEGNKIADKFNAQRTPEIFVIGKDQVIKYHGAVDNSQYEQEVKNHYLADTLTALIEGKEVPQKETKFFGCAIKRAES